MAEKRLSDMTEDELKSLIAGIVDEKVAQRTRHLTQTIASFRQALARRSARVNDDSMPDDYDEATDPVIKGLFSETSDVASRAAPLKYAAHPDEYNPDEDPTIAITAGPTDFADRAEDILNKDIKYPGGWTQKDDE